MKRVLLAEAMALIWALGSIAAKASDDLPAGFRFIGNYKFEKRVKIREGVPLSVPSKPFIWKVYTDGITVRVYGSVENDGYTSFSIYRNDGVVVKSASGIVETVPGVQAQTLVGDVARQLTLTQERLVLTRFPALSDLVEVTYANRLITLTRGPDDYNLEE